ncbi:MAG TPA: hypothetical protein VGR43_01175 [Dehalococcoidia bacterium]|nr:hypothetical protein [Dehalococcoidia bacterium]
MEVTERDVYQCIARYRELLELVLEELKDAGKGGEATFQLSGKVGSRLVDCGVLDLGPSVLEKTPDLNFEHGAAEGPEGRLPRCPRG